MSVLMRLYPVRGGSDGYLKSFDPEAHDGIGDVVLTQDPKRAEKFASKADAMECWRTVPKCRPKRDDGKPNRPLTAYHAMIEEWSEETA